MESAFERPTLRLLKLTHAPVICAVLRSVFGETAEPVPAAVLHVRVREEIQRLAEDGVSVPMRGPDPIGGREAALEWMRAGFLRREAADDGEEYHLTAASAEALRVVEGLVEERALISRSRLGTIVDALSRTAADANPDRDQRIARLTEQIEELEAERNRLAVGGDLAVVSDDALIQGLESLINLLDQLPGDFRRVSEAFGSFHRDLMSDFQREERHAGEVIHEYLAREDRIMEDTPEGRAFTGALELLQDEAVQARVKHDIEVLRAHPVIETLTFSEQEQLRRLLGSIQEGMSQVLLQRHRITAAASKYLRGRDAITDRELERVLRSLDRALADWMARTRPRAVMTIDGMPLPADVMYLRTQFDPLGDVDVDLEPLVDHSDEGPTPISEEDLRRFGGPQLTDLKQAVAAGHGTAAQLFAELPDHLRRPVDFIGLLQLSSGGHGWDEDLGTEQITAVRATGERVTFSVPTVEFPTTVEGDDD